MSAQLHTETPLANDIIAVRTKPARDTSGSIIFSGGDVGQAHVMAHRLFDAGRYRLGRQWLGRWLEDRSGKGSDWIHLEFHMAMFELATGDWTAAYGRFIEEILPSARATEWALTDAPALLWNLALRAQAPVDLPWETLRRTALRRMTRPAAPFVTLHNLLALAGAGDSASIRQWLRGQPRFNLSQDERIVAHLAQALSASIAGEFRRAADRLRRVLGDLPILGGSYAQNRLFAELEHSWRRLAGERPAADSYADAA